MELLPSVETEKVNEERGFMRKRIEMNDPSKLLLRKIKLRTKKKRISIHEYMLTLLTNSI